MVVHSFFVFFCSFSLQFVFKRLIISSSTMVFFLKIPIKLNKLFFHLNWFVFFFLMAFYNNRYIIYIINWIKIVFLLFYFIFYFSLPFLVHFQHFIANHSCWFLLIFLLFTQFQFFLSSLFYFYKIFLVHFIFTLIKLLFYFSDFLKTKFTEWTFWIGFVVEKTMHVNSACWSS